MTKTVQGGTKRVPSINPSATGQDLTSAINDRLRRASGLQTKGTLILGNAVTIDAEGFLVDGGPIQGNSTLTTGPGINGFSGAAITVNGHALANNITVNGH